MTDPIKTGLASYGMSGQVFHAPFLDTDERFTLLSVLQRQGDQARQDYPQVQIERSYNELLANKELELIVVNTPNHLHYLMAKEALEADKHVLVEKPFTTHYSEAEELIQLARQKNKVLYGYQNRRWDSDFLTVKKIVEADLLGNIVYYEANWDRYRNYIKPNTWKEESRNGTGMLYDLGSHLIDQVLVLFGPPERVQGSLRTNRAQGQVVDYFDAKLFYPEREVALRGSYLAMEPRPRFLLQGVRGSFVKHGLDPQEDALKLGRKPQGADWGTEDPGIWGTIHRDEQGLIIRGTVQSLPGDYRGLFADLYAAIREKEEPYVKPGQVGTGIRIIEAIIASDEEKKSILL
ncbi:MAG: Gfo/Idh/MocA family oxidoreductase [Bacteroidia bacterium]|nr:Gfo/Idh/MocA family oxidoreductase [Bacteroidia bacterium]